MLRWGWVVGCGSRGRGAGCKDEMGWDGMGWRGGELGWTLRVSICVGGGKDMEYVRLWRDEVGRWLLVGVGRE